MFNVYRQIDQIPKAPRGIALGVFDGVHRGHRHLIAMLKEASQQRGLRPCVFSFSYETGIGFNDRKVNHDFLMTDDEKIAVLEELGIQDVFLIPLTSEFCHLSPTAFLTDVLMNQLGTKLLAIGEDGRFGWGGRGDASFLKDFSENSSLESLIVPDLLWQGTKVTSTRIREALADGHVEEAAEMMQRPYYLSGIVVSGSSLGSKIGFPTANILFPPTSALLRCGVYATHAVIDGERWPSISNVGVAPSVREAGSDILIETHIYDFSGDLYGKRIAIEFNSFIRDECTFSSLHDLVTRVHADLDAVRSLHNTN